MRLRQKYAIPDRLRILLILLFVLIVLIALACYGDRHVEEIEQSSTMESFLLTAIAPVGSTMYIWGGGWDDADAQAGDGAMRIGLSPKWREFALLQDSDYDFEDYRFQRENGLDCSGYVGWTMYNIFATSEESSGYVTTSTDMAAYYASLGWGKLIENPQTFLPGDIVSMDGHVWISLGTCEDGSVLLLHSSPPGVSVCGTAAPEENSIAVQLAETFMTECYPKWQEKYPNRRVGHSYLENVSVMRWNSKVMKDVEQFHNMTGEAVLEYLFTLEDRR